MRVVSWNCMGRFEKKASALIDLAPDLAVVSEVTLDAALAMSGTSMVWTGADGSKGLALFGLNGWTLDLVLDAKDRHILAAQASKGSESILLVGVWTLPLGRDYVAPLVNALAQLEGNLSGEVIIAGDFNANPVWDKPSRQGKSKSFTAVIEALNAQGIQSVWHERSRERHGAEDTPTFYMYRHEDRPFHIDYVLASQGLRRRVEGVQIGAYETWIATGLSDHCPIVVDFAPARIPA